MKFLVEYEHDGATWGLEITASDEADAQARVASLGSAVLLGEIGDKLPARTPLALVD